jgi:hypothetical protein
MKPIIDMPPGAAAWVAAVTEYARLNHNRHATLDEILSCLQELEHQHQLGNDVRCSTWMRKNQLLFLNWVPCSLDQLGIDPTKRLSQLAIEIFVKPIIERILCTEVEWGDGDE